MEIHTRNAVVACSVVLVLLVITLGVVLPWIIGDVSRTAVSVLQGVVQGGYDLAVAAIIGYWLFKDARLRRAKTSIPVLIFISCFVLSVLPIYPYLFVLPIYPYLFYTRGFSRGIVSSLWLTGFLMLMLGVLVSGVFAMVTISRAVSG